MEKKKSGRGKRLATVLFVLFNIAVIAVTAYYDFVVDSDAASKSALRGVSPLWLLAALACFLGAIAAETVKYQLLIRHTTGSVTLRTAFETFALGKYYDNITPLGAGGQPFQMVYLSRQGLDSGAAGAIPVAGFLSLQIAFILLALVTLPFSFGTIITSVPFCIAAIVGLLFYMFIPAAIILFAASPAAAEKVLHWGVGLAGRLHILRHPESAGEKALTSLRSYTESLRSIGRGQGILTRTLLLSLVYQFILCSLPYFVLRAFGCSLSYPVVLCTCVFVYLSITFVPTPGNSGVAEGSFYTLFSLLAPDSLFWAMLIWRFFSYYGFILLGLIIQWRGAFKKKKTT